MAKKHLILLFLLFLCAQASKAQGYGGREFWLALMDLDKCEPDSPPYPPKKLYSVYWYDTAELYLTSPTYATVVVSMEEQRDGDNGIERPYCDTFYLLPNITTHVLLPTGAMCRYTYSDWVVNNGIHIVADSIIFVQAVNRQYRIKGATAILPVSSIPAAPEYMISTNEATATYGCLALNGWLPSTCSEFVIVGIADESFVEIFSNSGSLITGSQPEKPNTHRILKGETLFFIGTASSGNRIDLSGTIIRSKTIQSKFAVFAGNKKSTSTLKNRNGVSCASSPDHLYEQLTPVSTWGNQYTALPFKNNPGGYFLKILASGNNTRILIDGQYYATLNARQHLTYNVNKDSVSRISSSLPVSVMQFSKGSSCNEMPAPKTGRGNLSMLQLLPDVQMGYRAMVNYVTHVVNWWGSDTSRFAPESYVNVLTKTADTSDFTVNGQKLPVSSWKTSPQMNGLSYAQIYIDSSSHDLISNKGFLSYTYGYAGGEGFSYTSGGSMRVLNNHFIFNKTCKTDTTIFTAILHDSFSNARWRIAGDPGIKSGSSFRYVFPDTGYQSVTMFSTHKRTGQTDSITKYIYIAVANQTPVLCNDTLICGKMGFILASRYLTRYKSYLWNGGHPNYAQYIKNPGLYWVRVTERSGCSYTDSVVVSNTPNPFADFSMSDTAACFNKNPPVAFVNRSVSVADSIVSNVWDFDDFLPVDTAADTVFHRFTKTGQHYIRFRVTTTAGCFDDTFAVFEVLKAPVSEFSMYDVDSCLRTNQVRFVNNTIKDSTLQRRFKWFFSEGYVISNNNPPAPRRYDSAGRFSANLIYEFQNGCIDTATRHITIFKDPEADFSLAAAVPCNGDSVQFENKSISDQHPMAFKWQFGDLISSADSAPLHLYPDKGRYTVTLHIRTPQGCTDSMVKPVYISGATVADFSIDDSIQCLGNNLFRLNSTSATDTGNIVLTEWRFSDGSSGSSSAINKSFLMPGSYRILLKVSNNFTCSDSIEKTVMVRNAPGGTILVNKPSQCEDRQDFDFSFNAGSGNDSLALLRWVLGNDSLDGPVFSNRSFPAAGTQNIRLKLLSKYGCAQTLNRNVYINPAPAAAFDFNPAAQCLKNNKVLLTNRSSISQGQIAAFNWTFGDQSSSALFNPGSKSYTAAGNYAIILQCTSDSGCMASDTAWIGIHPSPTVQMDPILPVCLGDSSVFSAQTSISSGSVTSLRWDFGDQSGSSANKAKHRYQAVGTYPVRLVAVSDQNCADSSGFGNAVVLALPEVSFRYQFLDAGDQKTQLNFYNNKTGQTSQWDFGGFAGSTRDSSLIFSDSQTLRVTLKVSDRNGCSNSRTEYIFIGSALRYFIPNAFSPNGDGHNDGFKPLGIEYVNEYVFTVYNRWGEIVFRSMNPQEGWDGTYMQEPCAAGVYIYTLELRDFFFRYQNQEGSVLLLR